MKLSCSDPEAVAILPSGQKKIWLYTLTVEIDGVIQTRRLCHLEQMTQCEALQRLQLAKPEVSGRDLLTVICDNMGFAEVPGSGEPGEDTRSPVTDADELLMAILAAEDEAIATRVRAAAERLAESP